MTDQTNTTVLSVFQGYHWVSVQPANGGFGEYVAGPEKGDEYYPDADDVIKAQGPGEHLSAARGD